MELTKIKFKKRTCKNKNGQMKIQQMAFMIIAVFFLFVLVGLFFIRVKFSDLSKSVEQLRRDQAISSLEVIADMPELNCGSSDFLCLDEDKLRVMSGNFSRNYDDFWPVASIEVFKVYPSFNETIECPSPDCNHYSIFDNGQKNKERYPTYISICRKVRGKDDQCEIGKLVVGMKINEAKK